MIVCNGADHARGYNRRNTDKNTLSHAELNAIKKASKKLGDWRLEGCTMYVTLEPCQMCAGALMQSRIDRVVIGSMNPKQDVPVLYLIYCRFRHLIISAKLLKVYVKKNVQKCSQHFSRNCVKARKRILLSLLMENDYEI